eukprot:9532151-Ditylum_brightwellii.AAC.1
MQQPTVLPAENNATKAFKRGGISALCEQVTMLVCRGDALAFKHRRNEIPTPMVAEGKVSGAQGHPGKLHVGKLQRQPVILPNGGVDALHFFGDTKGSSSGQGNILALHGTLDDDGLKFATPQNRT